MTDLHKTNTMHMRKERLKIWLLIAIVCICGPVSLSSCSSDDDAPAGRTIAGKAIYTRRDRGADAERTGGSAAGGEQRDPQDEVRWVPSPPAREIWIGLCLLNRRTTYSEYMDIKKAFDAAFN